MNKLDLNELDINRLIHAPNQISNVNVNCDMEVDKENEESKEPVGKYQ